MADARICGLVLAGGQSRRFGAEKAVAPFGAALMLDAVLARFDSLPHRAISARVESAAAAHGRKLKLPVLSDAPDAPRGPLSGVVAGLAWARSCGCDVLVTAPCDTPLLPHDFAERLIVGLGAAPAAFAATADQEHPLCAAWRLELHAPLTAALCAGAHPPVRAFLREVGARRVVFEDARAFTNANTLAALQALEAAA